MLIKLILNMLSNLLIKFFIKEIQKKQRNKRIRTLMQLKLSFNSQAQKFNIKLTNGVYWYISLKS